MFGATGDLARRKLLPGLFRLAAAGLMPDRYQIVGSARRGLTGEQFREHARQAVADFGTIKPEGDAWDAFQRSLSFASAEPGRTEALAAAVGRAEREIGGALARLCHLAVPPAAFESTLATLSAAGLAAGSRVIIEKPFGTDLASARELNQKVHALFSEPQVFRIDHFLGKESVGNILAFRFANGLFEPVWNRNHIAYVQIDVPETLSIEGRADFYDHTGAYRDMIVTHLFQVLAFVAMEPPTSLDARHLRDETAKVFDAVRPIDIAHVVRGQYAGYTGESGVAEGSGTETMAAVRAEVDNWRWAGVPFYVRSGKRLPKRSSEIAIQFRAVPHRLFTEAGADPEPNLLAMRIQPDEGILLRFGAKVPGLGIDVRAVNMDFTYGSAFSVDSPDAYETLILDALLGDASLFTRADEVEAAWSIVTPIIETWAIDEPPAFPNYEAGTWGPDEAHQLLARDGRRWRRIEVFRPDLNSTPVAEKGTDASMVPKLTPAAAALYGAACESYVPLKDVPGDPFTHPAFKLTLTTKEGAETLTVGAGGTDVFYCRLSPRLPDDVVMVVRRALLQNLIDLTR
jgi:glucose-6-phosphate 1-dehydrogenase